MSATSMPARVAAAKWKALKPRVGRVLPLMKRWSGSNISRKGFQSVVWSTRTLGLYLLAEDLLGWLQFCRSLFLKAGHSFQLHAWKTIWLQPYRIALKVWNQAFSLAYQSPSTNTFIFLWPWCRFHLSAKVRLFATFSVERFWQPKANI